MTRYTWRTISAALLASGLAASGSVAAAASADPAWPALTDPVLAELRGGFINSDGFQIHFSLENLVSIDGALQVHERITIPMMGGVPQFGAGQTVDSEGTVVLTQGLSTLIQNSMDDKTIQHLRMLNVEMRNLHGIGAVGMINRLQPGLISALRQ